ncbi:hypothetical protein [Acetobacter cerevisiae]|uniref:hypothetical protein n=1 Tax=Acetobacter cerevisiae TaxID=178900 RepID=UPI00209FC50E|nr:hypothetical protein [Acetobacter cerevisiae]MCP1270569.1 hypothetical protein [Acetobacter cerevisiae]MCP1278523.1 hypothetical protein [Acetobacter cerevisiae]
MGDLLSFLIAFNIVLIFCIFWGFSHFKNKIVNEKIVSYNNALDALTVALQFNDENLRINLTAEKLAKSMGSGDVSVIKELYHNLNAISLVMPLRERAPLDDNERDRALGAAIIEPEDGDCERVINYINEAMDNGRDLRGIKKTFSNETLVKVECFYKRRVLYLYYIYTINTKMDYRDLLCLNNIKTGL